jgi:hypothetical protein
MYNRLKILHILTLIVGLTVNICLPAYCCAESPTECGKLELEGENTDRHLPTKCCLDDPSRSSPNHTCVDSDIPPVAPRNNANSFPICADNFSSKPFDDLCDIHLKERLRTTFRPVTLPISLLNVSLLC